MKCNETKDNIDYERYTSFHQNLLLIKENSLNVNGGMNKLAIAIKRNGDMLFASRSYCMKTCNLIQSISWKIHEIIANCNKLTRIFFWI